MWLGSLTSGSLSFRYLSLLLLETRFGEGKGWWKRGRCGGKGRRWLVVEVDASGYLVCLEQLLSVRQAEVTPW